MNFYVFDRNILLWLSFIIYDCRFPVCINVNSATYFWWVCVCGNIKWHQATPISIVISNLLHILLSYRTVSKRLGWTQMVSVCWDLRKICTVKCSYVVLWQGALLGAGASVISVGSDIGGSLRLPAIFCCVYGHKPTPGQSQVNVSYSLLYSLEQQSVIEFHWFTFESFQTATLENRTTINNLTKSFTNFVIQYKLYFSI